MIIDCSLENFRKNFNENFKRFYLRIREYSNDIAYFNGIKAFEISKNDDKTVRITIPKDIYKLNATNVKKSKDNETDIIKLLNNLKNKYFDEKLTKIIIRKGTYSYDKNNHLKTIKAFENIRKSLEKNLKHFENELNDDVVNKILYSFDNNKNSYEIKVTSYNDDLNIERIFIENSGRKYGLAKPIFKYKKTTHDKVIEVEDLYKDTKNAIEKYENYTKINLEKKYQQQFILEANRFFLTNMHSFEEEYYIKEKKTEITSNDDKNGRVDVILYKRDGNILKDLYLIELKVDDKVIVGDNGILIHLDDIKSLLMKTNFNNIDKNNFFYMLKDRIEYRIKTLENSDFKFKNSKNKIDYNIHFYTIMAFTNNESKGQVIKYLKSFKTKEGINDLIESRKPCKNDNEKFKNKNIYDICNPIKEKCDIKFFFDECNWNKETTYFTPNFKDVTNIYFEGINNE